MNTRTTLVCGLATLVVLTSLAMSQRPLHAVQQRSAGAEEATDTRERIRLAPAERDARLAERRTMLKPPRGGVHRLVCRGLGMAAKGAPTSRIGAAIRSQPRKKPP